MSFDECTVDAEKWINSEYNHLRHFRLVSLDRDERRLNFQNDMNLSFYIICPEDGCEDGAAAEKQWNVWSDHPEAVAKMEVIQDYIHSCKEKSIADILNFITHKLCSRDSVTSQDDDDGFDSEVSNGNSDEGNSSDADEGLDDYYAEPDADAAGVDHGAEAAEGEEAQFFAGNASPSAISRLLKDYNSLKKSKGSFGVRGQPKSDNILVWEVTLSDFTKGSILEKDLQKYAIKYKREPVVSLEVEFPPTYPMLPPFVRVIRPRFKFLTGHVTIGGSICMELLSPAGWRPCNDIESILVQIRSEIMSDKKASLDSNPDRQYTKEEAKQAFQRMILKYNWNK